MYNSFKRLETLTSFSTRPFRRVITLYLKDNFLNSIIQNLYPIACLVNINYVINEIIGGKKYFLYLFIEDCRGSLELGLY
jgi:hypothetical protein